MEEINVLIIGPGIISSLPIMFHKELPIISVMPLGEYDHSGTMSPEAIEAFVHASQMPEMLVVLQKLECEIFDFPEPMDIQKKSPHYSTRSAYTKPKIDHMNKSMGHRMRPRKKP